MTKKGFKQTEETKRNMSIAQKGRKQTEETKKKISLAHMGKIYSSETIERMRIANIGSKNPSWKGDKVGYNALHEWIRQHKPKPQLCEGCKKKSPYDLANISQQYKRNVNDFTWLCRKCHMTQDGRTFRFI